ncbi:MAG TPA: hypothetical protein PK593_00080 [Thermomicrobiales bacterium]|nr:hypothetical protein [Thermomicrobiales bacterium]HQZ90496.1 hypothetical protein [Thermomicrobiales bacterium]HRA32554.1 hypothetical protein [Thermomicrobiales bacterium]
MIGDAEYGALVIFTEHDMLDDVRRVLARAGEIVSHAPDLAERLNADLGTARDALSGATVGTPVFVVQLGGLRALAVVMAATRDLCRARPAVAVELGIEPANMTAAAMEFRQTVDALRIARQARLS